MTSHRLTLASVALAAMIVAWAAVPATSNDGPPSSIAALGDSITKAACTDPSCADRPANSWSTGTNPAVASHLSRLQAIWKNKLHVRSFKFASSAGATMADLASQAREASNVRAQYVTIELGENDLCGTTTPAQFRTNLERGLAALTNHPKILVLSIENEAAHWRTLRADPTAAKAFKNGSVLDCGLGYFTATPALLAKIHTRTIKLNEILAAVCSKHPLCLYDNGTYYRLPIKPDDFSPADYQHLSRTGQRALAAAEWNIALRILYY